MKRMAVFSTLVILLMSLLVGGMAGRADGRSVQAAAGPGVAVPSADGVWELQAGGAFGDVYFVDAYRGWVVGWPGLILHTANGGTNWLHQVSGTTADLHSVHFVDAQRGWVVGGGGLILHTTDGGSTWSPQASGTGPGLESVHFVDAQNGWAVGSGGTTLHTADGGSTWLPQTSGTTADLLSVYFVDAQNGWAAGNVRNWSCILHTTDGGSTWWEQGASSSDVMLGSVHFVDDQNGWVVGGGESLTSSIGIIRHTSDGGTTWSYQESGTRAGLASVHFADAQNGWAVGGGGTILHTTDSGSTWLPQAGAEGRLNSVHFADAQGGWAVGLWGAILHTADGGSIWLPQASRTEETLRSVHFVDAQKGWAVGGGGTIVHTADGGSTWSPQASGTTAGLNSVHFADAQRGWAVGWRWLEGFAEGTILHTADGGSAWLPQASGTTAHLNSVHFVDAQNGWVAGEGGTILHTADGGSIWSPQASGTGVWLESVHFLDAQNGWVVGGEGTILHTAHGGSIWSPQASGTEAWLSSVHFADAQNGWAVGSRPVGDGLSGVIAHTTNGGATWTVQESMMGAPLNAVYFVNRDEGWAVGDGLILHYTTEGAPALFGAIAGGDDDTCVREETGENRVRWEHIRLGKSMYDYVSGFRFADAAIPQGARIIAAYLSFYPTGWYTGLPVAYTVYGEAADDAVSFADGQPLAHLRPRTEAAMPWTLATVPGGWFNTPDLAPLIQEVVDRAGWQEGNALSLLVASEASNPYYVDVWAYDGNPALAARLHVFYRPKARPDLRPSTKAVDKATALPGEVVEYTISLLNIGEVWTSARVTDTIPAHTDYVPGSLRTHWWCTFADGLITCDVPVDLAVPEEISFEARVSPTESPGTVITNTAIVDDGAGMMVERSASTTVVYPANTWSGPIWADTLWTLDQSPYYVAGDITVREGVTLTIEPGVEVRFFPRDAVIAGVDPERVELIVRGTLMAQGDAALPITFTSATSTPAGGDWYGIRFSDSSTDWGSSGCMLDHAVIRYARVGISVDAASPMISNSIISDVKGSDGDSDCSGHGEGAEAAYGIYCVNGSSPTISGNTVSAVSGGEGGGKWGHGPGGEGVGIYLHRSSPTVLDNTISHVSGGRGSDGWRCEGIGLGGDGGDGVAIYVEDSLPAIVKNTIWDVNGGDCGEGYNSGLGGLGAGIYSVNSPPFLIDENRVANVTGGRGSIDIDHGVGVGIYLRDSSPLVTGNKVTEIRGGEGGWSEDAGFEGGIGAGILSDNGSEPIISDNTISGVTGGRGQQAGPCCLGGRGGIGAGIYSRDSWPAISHNIISSVRGGAGGLGRWVTGGTGGEGIGIEAVTSWPQSFKNVVAFDNLILDVSGGGGGEANADDPEGGEGGDGIGIHCGPGSSFLVTNNTVLSTAGGAGGPPNGAEGVGIGVDAHSWLTATNNIISGHTLGIRCSSPPCLAVSYNDVWGNATDYVGLVAGANDISADPLFVTGPDGGYYLSQKVAGWALDSPCVDAGSDMAANLGLDGRTTRTDGVVDAGIVDLGYHYSATTMPTPTMTPTSTATPTPTTTPAATLTPTPAATASPAPGRWWLPLVLKK